MLAVHRYNIEYIDRNADGRSSSQSYRRVYVETQLNLLINKGEFENNGDREEVAEVFPAPGTPNKLQGLIRNEINNLEFRSG